MATGRRFTQQTAVPVEHLRQLKHRRRAAGDLRFSRNVNLGDITYKKIGSDFYAVSGTRGEMIYYERCNFPNDDVLTRLYVSYPAAEKAKWDPIVARIGRSLRLAQTGSQ